MMRGMSSEKPALDLFLCIETIWSPYEMMGDMTMKKGAAKPVRALSQPMMNVNVRLQAGLQAVLARYSQARKSEANGICLESRSMRPARCERR